MLNPRPFPWSASANITHLSTKTNNEISSRLYASLNNPPIIRGGGAVKIFRQDCLDNPPPGYMKGGL